MKKIFAMAALALSTQLQAQVMRIETELGTKVYDLSRVKSVSFSDEANTEPLTTVEMVNASPLAFDLSVKKSASCLKYMAAVYNKEVYKESDFVFAAEQTLDKNAYYRPYEQTLRYEDDLFSESALGLNSLTDDSGKPLTLLAAVYAVDDLGGVQVSTQELSLPTELAVESSIKMKIEVDEQTLTYDRVDYTISQQGWTRPAKIIYGATEPANLKTTATAFKRMTEEEQRNFMMEKALGGVPQAYTSAIKGTHQTSPGSSVILFALPIDSEGKVGEMAVKVVDTPKLTFTGTGSFTGCELVEQTEWDQISFRIGVSDNVTAYRLMWVSKTEDSNSDYVKSKLPEIFLLPKYKDYGLCHEFPATETTATLELYRPDTYLLYGATVDSEGNVSTPVNLIQTYVNPQGTVTTIAKPAEE